MSIVLERMRFEGVVDMFQTVNMLRMQRPFMVQSEVGRCVVSAAAPCAKTFNDGRVWHRATTGIVHATKVRSATDVLFQTAPLNAVLV